jgi:hypothetical protein
MILGLAGCATTAAGVSYDAHLKASIDMGVSAHGVSTRNPVKTDKVKP